jgi:hypothetical protein
MKQRWHKYQTVKGYESAQAAKQLYRKIRPNTACGQRPDFMESGLYYSICPERSQRMDPAGEASSEICIDFLTWSHSPKRL